ncbi:MAG: Fe-S oxidoreductase [Desulfobulbus propionicus]|nr:MAG: Fe-S oxidoreductase [Desulfobulbus propionicus]
MEHIEVLSQKIFQCTRCGYCCHGATTVSLSPYDQERMAAALGITEEEARERYWRITGTVVQMQVVDGHCIFYDEQLRGCRVHQGRPERCREWPLHPSMIHDHTNYLTITESCPGLNTALSYQEFCVHLEKIVQARSGAGR